MTTKTAKKEPVADLFDKAISSYEQALKSGVKLQEEALKVLTDLFNEAGLPEEVQAKMQTVAAESIPVAQKNLQDALKLIEQNSKASLSLLEQAIKCAPVESITDGQTKTKELWESSLNVLRANTEATAKANAKALESWTEFVRKSAVVCSS